MTEKYKQHHAIQLPSVQKYQEAFKAMIDDLFNVNPSNFTEHHTVLRPASTNDVFKRVSPGFKYKEVVEEKLNKPALTEWIENTKNTLTQSSAKIISQIEEDQESIKKEYDPILSQIPALSDLAIAESSLGAAIIEVEKFLYMTSKGSLSIPTQQQSLETILAALQKAKESLFDTEHSLTDPKTVTDSQDYTASDITEEYVSITEDQVEKLDPQDPNNSKAIPILGESTNGVFLIDDAGPNDC